MRDFVDFVAGSSDTPTNEDGQPKTFNEMDDNELLKCLSDYLGSGVANTSINGAGIELAQDLLAEMYMSEEELAELTNPKTPNARELKERKLLEKVRDAAEEERSRLSKEDRDFLAGQTINLGDGKSASALDIVNSLDKMLDHWDKSFDDMVEQGIAQPQDKDKLKQSMTKYRNMMADTKLSAEEKEKKRREMIASGEITAAQMDYADTLAMQEKENSQKQQYEIKKDKHIATQEVSVVAGANDFEKENINNKKEAPVSLFNTSVDSGIESSVKLTQTYNSSATATPEPEKKSILTVTPASPKVTAQAVSGDMAFG